MLWVNNLLFSRLAILAIFLAFNAGLPAFGKEGVGPIPKSASNETATRPTRPGNGTRGDGWRADKDKESFFAQQEQSVREAQNVPASVRRTPSLASLAALDNSPEPVSDPILSDRASQAGNGILMTAAFSEAAAQTQKISRLERFLDRLSDRMEAVGKGASSREAAIHPIEGYYVRPSRPYETVLRYGDAQPRYISSTTDGNAPRCSDSVRDMWQQFQAKEQAQQALQLGCLPSWANLHLNTLMFYHTNFGLTVTENDDAALYGMVHRWYNTPYRWGGMSKRSVDCSGLVCIVMDSLYGLKMPRNSYYQYLACDPVEKEELTEGDLVFFRINRRHISHVGIYLKDHKFVHAALAGGVIVSDLRDPYYRRYYYGSARPNHKDQIFRTRYEDEIPGGAALLPQE